MTATVTPIYTHEQVCALAAPVRDGELSPEQREQLARLLHRIDSAHGLAPLAAYSELLSTVTPAHPGGQGWARSPSLPPCRGSAPG